MFDIYHHVIYPLTARVNRTPQMISQPVSSIFPCSPLPSGTWRTAGLAIAWCCLPTSSSVCLVFFPLSLCLARWFWLDVMNGRHVHTTAVCVSLRCVRRSSCSLILELRKNCAFVFCCCFLFCLFGWLFLFCFFSLSEQEDFSEAELKSKLITVL